MFDSLLESSKIELAANCLNFANNMGYVNGKPFLYLPNIFEKPLAKSRKEAEDTLHIGIFGAVRLLKNHLTQVVAAIRFAEEKRKILNLHVNELTSDAGSTILGNIKELFKRCPKHKLIVEPYRSGMEYDNLIRYMDIGMQLSFTESFNIVAANFVCNGVPIVVGETIDWMPKSMKVSYNNVEDIVGRLNYAYTNRNNPVLQFEQYQSLMRYNEKAKNSWDQFIRDNL